MLLEIKNLHVSVNGNPILKGINLQINKGEIHAIMGPNGSGKSTLSCVIAGKDGYHIEEGSVLYEGENLLELAPEVRSHKGIFLGFQYPIEIPGVSNINFLKSALTAQYKAQNKPAPTAGDFLKLVREKAALVALDAAYLNRGVNVGFSGGEKKRNEIFQMAVLNPTLAILDETDSGLDIDALRVVSSGVNKLKSKEKATVIITHYQRLLDYIIPDFIHVLHDGKIIKSGGKELALELEEKGYDWLKT